ncbi:hypothetical protein GCM10009639_47920 [Kitasatospora putterlickiae]|uniref:Uncharacterized protein n=1 Tax=Kitasatospora putterlickiae TaxID=221725 RepID=A0ABN1YDH5_9ACTN
MTHQRHPIPSTGGGERPVTWRDVAIYGHGLLTTVSLHFQVGWPTTTAAAVGLTGPVMWELLRRQR